MGAIESALDKALASAHNGDYEGALGYLETISDQPDLPSRYFLLKGRLIQSSDGLKYSLEDSRNALTTALQLAPDDAEVHSELGFFYSRVIPDKVRACEHFRRAVERLRFLYAEAVAGLIETVSESPDDSLSLILEEMQLLRKRIEDDLK